MKMHKGIFQIVSLEGWVRSIVRSTAPAVDGGQATQRQLDRRRYLGESSSSPADYSPNGPRPSWSQNYQGGTHPTASPSCNESVGTHALNLSLYLKLFKSDFGQSVCFYLIRLLSSLSTCRFLNCRMLRGTSVRWLLSNRSSTSERYVPTKELRSMLWSLSWLWDSWRDCRPGRRWRKEKTGIWWMLLCWRDSLWRRRGRFMGIWVNRL